MRAVDDVVTVAEPMCRMARGFRALAERPRPLRLLIGDLGAGLPQEAVDVLELKRWLLEPGVDYGVRGAVWGRVLELTGAGGRVGEEWRLAAVGLAWPGLWRVASRCCRGLGRADREDVQQALLGGFWEALVAMRADGGWRAEPGRIPARLVWAADRAARAVVAQLARARATQVPLEQVPVAGAAGGGPEALLAVAVARGVLDAAMAEVIVRSRVEGVPISRLAAQAGCTAEALGMRRKRAERRLAAALAAGELDWDGPGWVTAC